MQCVGGIGEGEKFVEKKSSMPYAVKNVCTALDLQQSIKCQIKTKHRRRQQQQQTTKIQDGGEVARRKMQFVMNDVYGGVLLCAEN